MAFFCQPKIGGRKYSNSKNAVKNVNKDVQKRFMFYKFAFFKVTLLQDSTYIVQVPFPVFCARFSVKGKQSHPERSANVTENGV